MHAVCSATILAEWVTTGTAIAMAVVGGGLVLSVALSLYQRRRAGPEPDRPGAALTPHEELERVKQDHGMHRDLAEVAAEVERMAKRLGTQLDRQATHLEGLIHQADARIARLEKLAGTPGRATTPASTDAPAPPNASEPDAPKQDDAFAPAAGASLQPDDPLARKVYALADQGAPPEDIARKIGEHVGKVELILALRSV
jgi:hypothetical protein